MRIMCSSVSEVSRTLAELLSVVPGIQLVSSFTLSDKCSYLIELSP